MKFYIFKNVLDLGVKIKGVLIENIDNETISEEYLNWRNNQVKTLIEIYRDFNVREDPVLEGFYALHEKVAVPRRKNIPASENLIRLLQKKEDLMEINKAVDIYNIISMKSKLALGAHDIDKINGNISLRLTDGSEHFLPLGATEEKPVKPGEYSYIDDNNDILCWLEIRQVEKDKVTENSKNIFYIVQGNEVTSDELMEETAKELIEVTTSFAGGQGRIVGQVIEM